MVYKGIEIEDHFYERKCEMIADLCSNDYDFTLDDIERWISAVEGKEKELIEKGVDFRDVRLNIYSDGYHSNPDGEDDDEFMKVRVTWLEMESEEARASRIEALKRNIDETIEHERLCDGYYTRFKMAALKKLRESGCQVTRLSDIWNANNNTNNDTK